MYDPNENELNDVTDITDEPHLVLDGTVSLDDYDDDSVPRIRGLVELFNDFLGH